MNILDILQSVQFIKAQGKRFAVVDAEAWETLVAWLENLEDLQILSQAAAELEANEGDREKAGWLNWDTVAGEIE